MNVSPRQLVDSGFPAAVRFALDAAGLPPAQLCLEVTESTVAADHVRVLRRLEELRTLGVSLSLDDFGTGLSSLSDLSGYPVDTLKVDRSFVAQLSEGVKGPQVFASVVGVAHALGIRALAEGVETRAQLEEVYKVGCDAAQGFFVRSDPLLRASWLVRICHLHEVGAEDLGLALTLLEEHAWLRAQDAVYAVTALNREIAAILTTIGASREYPSSSV